jgi:integrase
MPREIPISDALRAALAGPRRHDQWLFPTRHGGRYKEFPKDVYNRIRKAAGLVGGPHTTRHTFASHFLQAVPDMFLLAQVLGHSHQRVTELYSHLLPEHLSRARNAVNIGPAIKTMATAMATKRGSA